MSDHTYPSPLVSESARITKLHQQLYGGANPGPILDELRLARQNLATRLLETAAEQIVEDWEGETGKVLRLIADGPLFSVPLDGREMAQAEAIASEISSAATPSNVLAGMLYWYAFELPLPTDSAYMPPPLLEAFVRWIVRAPMTFSRAGDIDRFADHCLRWASYCLDGLVQGRPNPSWRDTGFLFGSFINSVPLYFTDRDLRDFFSLRAQILDRMFRLNRWPLDYSFPKRSLGQKIRIGVLRRNFAGLTESYTTLPLFEHLDRTRFEIILFADEWVDAPSARRARERADRLALLTGDVLEKAKIIRQHDCDILLFGTNITAAPSDFVKLACFRLARVHMTNFASPVTTGFPFMDCYISGRLSEPGNNPQTNYTEQLLLLNGPGFCFEYGVDSFAAAEPMSRETLGFSRDAIIFASGANLQKIIPEIMDLWARILMQVQGSRLLLFPFGPAWSSSYDNVRFFGIFHETLARHGVSSDRLVAIQPLPNRAAVRNILKIADIYLDSPRHGGANSLVDPLALDIPTVVCEGSNLRALQGVGMVRELGIAELIAPDEGSYIRLAVELAMDPGRRRALSAKIRAAMQRPPSFLDPVAHSAELQHLYEQILRERGYLTD